MEKRIVILGGGESGCGAAILAKKLGFDVFLSDFGTIADKYKKMLDDANATHEGVSPLLLPKYARHER